eukprot:2325386-Rhodomonas_salina.2
MEVVRVMYGIMVPTRRCVSKSSLATKGTNTRDRNYPDCTAAYDCDQKRVFPQHPHSDIPSPRADLAGFVPRLRVPGAPEGRRGADDCSPSAFVCTPSPNSGGQGRWV